MTAVSTYAPAQAPTAVAPALTAGTARPIWMPLLPGLATLLGYLSWVAGGVPIMTDMAWAVMVAACLIFIIMELKAFPHRYGVGGLVLFGGFLFWFGQDYIQNWSFLSDDSLMLLESLAGQGVRDTQSLLAKATCLNFLFITFMTIGLLLPYGKWMSGLIARTPQPAENQALLVAIAVLFAFGLLPYFLFTSEPWYSAIWKTFFMMRSGSAAWTVGRTGTINYNWGAYVDQWLSLGQFAGLLAAFYAIFLARSGLTKAFCWFMWSYTLLCAFGTGTRGQIGYACIPIVGMLFIKYTALGSVTGKRWKPYVIAFCLMVGMLPLIRLQANFRNVGLDGASFDVTEMADLRDNTMFSHSLFVFSQIPEHRQPFYSRFPGQSTVVAIPQAVFFFAIGPIPRAAWRGKPIDPAMTWASQERSGVVTETSWTGVSSGLPGNWFALCGIPGLIQGGLLWGWLLAVFDRTLWLARAKPLILLVVLAFHTFVFRAFRDPDYQMIYPVLIGIAALWMLSAFTRKQPTAVAV